ncbi:MAG: SDR family oxidoreductase [Treponema sp.]|jgi:all-trans-retinol dehydrogenase (NAD+)|nr:SDR family oxidoreductase [Treponema sp.]
MKDITGRLVVITGGTSGMGRLMALDFAERGARVVVWDRNAAALKQMEETGKTRGLFIKAMDCDVSDREAVYRAAGLLEAELGPVDILINNAGVVSGSTMLDTPDEKVIDTFNVNTLALFWTTKAFLPGMLKRNSGHLVTIASAAGLIGITGLVDYSASKFAAFGYHEALAMELRGNRSAINTTLICPYYVDTGMFAGVSTRFPLFLPILKSEIAARRIVRAVLKNKRLLIMPSFIYTVFLLRLLPDFIFDGVVNFFGINHAMDHFTGRNREDK